MSVVSFNPGQPWDPATQFDAQLTDLRGALVIMETEAPCGSFKQVDSSQCVSEYLS